MFRERMRKVLSAFALAAAALLVGTASSPAVAPSPVSVFPVPGSIATLPQTQIVFRGVPASEIGSIHVVGSQSGSHKGHIAADSDGQGGSFLPNRPFVPGETVTVSTGLDVLRGHNGSFSFTIISPYAPYAALQLPFVSPVHGVQHFHSRPDLEPASVTITKHSPRSRTADVFLTPQYGPLQNGPELLDSSGRLIWFDPLPKPMLASDLRVQKLGRQPVLTWWQGLTNNGYGRGQGMIFDQQYHLVKVVHAADGLPGMDLHEFLVTPAGRAYIIGYSPVHWPGIGRPLMDGVVQEIDIKTGLVLFEWHALDHVPMSESFFKPRTAKGHVFDPYHLNSVAVAPDGNLIVSMRNTWAFYKVNHQTGQVMWTLGSNRSSFRIGPGAGSAFQHDVLPQSNGTFTMFDDGAGPPRVHSQSRALRIAVNPRKHTTRLVQQFEHTPGLSSNFEGNTQVLSGGDVFVGWGQLPYFSEFNRHGQLDFDGYFTTGSSSYRAYRFRWSAQPTTAPDVALGNRSKGVTKVYASWNGATTVSSWRVIAGDSVNTLGPVGSARRHGFETQISAHSEQRYFAVEALDSKGHVLAVSAVVS